MGREICRIIKKDLTTGADRSKRTVNAVYSRPMTRITRMITGRTYWQ